MEACTAGVCNLPEVVLQNVQILAPPALKGDGTSGQFGCGPETRLLCQKARPRQADIFISSILWELNAEVVIWLSRLGNPVRTIHPLLAVCAVRNGVPAGALASTELGYV